MDVFCVGRHGLLAMRRFITITFLLATSQAWAAFGYYSPISINSAQVPSTQTDFPVLVNVTDNRFKTVGNGGHVQNSSGFDIRPYTNSGLGTAITGYELERYNASTGEVVMWIKVSSLSSSTTPFVLAYGDSGISTDGSSTTTWSNSFGDVYHFADGTTLNLNSSVSGGHNGTGNNSPTATVGQIDGAMNLASASSQFVDTTTLTQSAAFTVSAWVNPTSLPNAYNTVVIRNASNADYVGILVKSTGKLAMLVGTSSTDRSYDGTGSHTLSTATWYYLTLTYSNAGGLIGYVNGASDGTHAGGANLSSITTSNNFGRDPVNAGRSWNGKIDQVPMSTVVRAPDWITTEYNNQSAPGTFETLGTEVALTAANNGWFYFFP